MFQSTLPTRGATQPLRPEDLRPYRFQSTLPTRGATVYVVVEDDAAEVSIHAPHTGSDRRSSRGAARAIRFNPRSPHGERRAVGRLVGPLDEFQSTLPTRGATAFQFVFALTLSRFNPRSPHGERHAAEQIRRDGGVFQSTLPTRGATPLAPLANQSSLFQSTLPTRGATTAGFVQLVVQILFQSTLPTRGATCIRSGMRRI